MSIFVELTPNPTFMLRFRILFIVLALTMFSFSSCSNHQTMLILHDVESYIQDRPDSALATIRAIDTTTLTSRSLRAHYALLHAMALDKNWIDTTDVHVVMPAVDYYDRHPSDIRRVKAWYYLGRIQQNMGNTPDASISFLKAERYSEQFEDVALKALIHLAISTIYSQTHFHEEALKYSERALSLFVEAKDSINAYAAQYGIAKEYYNLGRYVEADSLYRLLLDNSNVNPKLRSSLLCSYALSSTLHSGNYKLATELFERAITINGTLNNRNYWGAYAYALLQGGNAKRADQILAQLAVGRSSSQLYTYDSWKSLADAYVGDYESAYHLQKAASDIQDDNVKKAFRQSAIKAQKDFLVQANLESEKLAKRRQIHSCLSFALMIAIIVFLLFLFRRRKERNAQENEELMEAYKNLTMEHSILTTRYSDLSDQVDRIEKEKESTYLGMSRQIDRIENEKASVRNKYIQLCQSHFNRIGRINEVLYYHSTDKDNELYKELKRAIRNIGMDNKSLNEFELLLNETFDDVMVHFRDTFPNKKPRYYQLVSYLFAGFGSSTICVIIPGFQKHNVHVERYRLKQMIRASDSQYREQFLRLLS